MFVLVVKFLFNTKIRLQQDIFKVNEAHPGPILFISATDSLNHCKVSVILFVTILLQLSLGYNSARWIK